MGTGFLCWLKMFIVYAVIIFVVWAGFEYFVLGSFMATSMLIMGYSLPSAVVYGAILGIVFAAAQYALKPKLRKAPSPPAYRTPRFSYSKPVARKKKQAKRKAKKKKKRRR
ncbi:MAG: hypothetical protein ABIH83_00545 [Candidatus Micrarchaeota archaeon]